MKLESLERERCMMLENGYIRKRWGKDEDKEIRSKSKAWDDHGTF